MKSSPFLAANQRLERITENTLVVGVDIAKEVHVAQAATWRGIIMTRRPIRFENGKNGFDRFISRIQELQKEHGLNDVIVGMESTGHYFFNLANWLVDQGIEVVLVNPATTKRNKENRDNTPSKSDPKDAAVIAESISRGFYSPYRIKDPLIQRLNVLVRVREQIVKESSRTKNRIHGWLDLYFPEYESEVFKDIFCLRSLATLHQMAMPTDITSLTPEEIVERWTKHGLLRAGGKRGIHKAIELLKAAMHSVGDTKSLEEARWEIEYLVEDYERHQKRLQEAEEKMDALLEEIPQVGIIQSVGIGSKTCAAILACAGDLTEFDHGNQLLRLAGMNLAEKQSGKYKGHIKLSKRGNALLRKYLYLAVLQLLRQNQTFRAWHKRNVETKHMKPMASLVKLIGKLARVLVAMARKHEPFDAAMAELAA